MIPFFFILSLLAILVILQLIGKGFGERIFYVTLASVAAKLMIGLLNKVAGPLPGADVDAVTFELVGIELAQTWSVSGVEFLAFTDRYAYANVLAVLFYVDGHNIALVPMFNTALTTFAAFNVYVAARTLKVAKKHIYLIAIVLALNPIITLYSAVPMREAAIYALITLFFRVLVSRPRRPIVIGNPILLLTIAAAIYLHVGLAPLVLVLVAYGFNLSVSLKALLRVRNLAGLGVLLLIVSVALNSAVVLELPRMAKLLDPDTGALSYSALESAQEAKSRGSGAYTYPSALTGITVVDAAITGVYMTARLILSPFPWELRSASGTTVVKLFDLAFQIGLNLLAIRGLRGRRGDDPRVFLYASYLFMSLIFGLNTVNDGIALRHRAKFIWILVLVAFSLRIDRRQSSAKKQAPA